MRFFPWLIVPCGMPAPKGARPAVAPDAEKRGAGELSAGLQDTMHFEQMTRRCGQTLTLLEKNNGNRAYGRVPESARGLHRVCRRIARGEHPGNDVGGNT